MRKPMVAGNWKLNCSRASATALAEEIVAGAPAGIDVVVCPVSVHLAEVAAVVDGTAVGLGGQNACAHESGAYTGEVSSTMLSEFGARYVIIGHSERRSLFGDDNASCAERFKAVATAGLTPIFCVGETLEEREAGNTMKVVQGQLQAVLDFCGAKAFALDSGAGQGGVAVVAYEPVWAIGTGVTASPEQAQQVHADIREFIAASDKASAADLPLLYGGSVKPDNAAELFSQTDIDGGLIGGAALNSADFLAICNAAATS